MSLCSRRACGRNSQRAPGRGRRPVPRAAYRLSKRIRCAAPADPACTRSRSGCWSASVNAGAASTTAGATATAPVVRGQPQEPRTPLPEPRRAASQPPTEPRQTATPHSLTAQQPAMSAAETEEEAPPPQKKSIFSCLTNLPGVCVPQKSAEGEEPARRPRPRNL